MGHAVLPYKLSVELCYRMAYLNIYQPISRNALLWDWQLIEITIIYRIKNFHSVSKFSHLSFKLLKIQ